MHSKSLIYRLATAACLVVLALLVPGCSAPAGNNSAVRPLSTQTPAASPSPMTCDQAQLEALVGAAIDKALMGTTERSHVNFVVRGCVVALQGWVSTPELHAAVIDEVSAIQEVTRIKTLLFVVGMTNYPHRPTGPCACADGYIPCGDICIPKDDKCNTPGCVGGVATPEPTKSVSKP